MCSHVVTEVDTAYLIVLASEQNCGALGARRVAADSSRLQLHEAFLCTLRDEFAASRRDYHVSRLGTSM